MGEMGFKSLKKNLNQIGIRNIEKRDLDIIRYSPAEEDKNNEAYKFVNERFLEIIEDTKNGKYLHITGEMKALGDPSHRKGIRKLYDYNNQKFRIIFSLPENYETNVFRIKEYNREKWKYSNWIDHLDSFDLLGEGKVSLYNKYNREDGQYSLFGKDFILFQSIHTTEDYVKEVWVIYSKKLFKILEKRAEPIFKSSQLLTPLVFNQFNSSLSTSTTLHLLFFLYDNNNEVDREEFLLERKKIEYFTDFDLNALISIRFINDNGSTVRLNEDGKEFLKLFI